MWPHRLLAVARGAWLAILWWSALMFPARAEPGPLVRLLQSGRLPAERVPQVVEMACQRGGPDDLAYLFERARSPDGFEHELRVKVLGWLAAAATERKVQPQVDAAAVPTLLAEALAQHPDLAAAALKLAIAWRTTSVAPLLQELAQSEGEPYLRRLAIEGLAALDPHRGRTVLERLAAADGPFEIRQAAVVALVPLDAELAARSAAKLLLAASPDDESGPLLDAFLRRKGASDLLATALAPVKLAPDVAKRALRHMYGVGRSDAALSGVLSEQAGVGADPPPPTPQEVQALAAEVLARGDPARGERVFRRADLNCFRCHALGRAGGNVGPDLSAVGGVSPMDYIINSILNPSLAIKEQYLTRSILTADGQLLTGIVLERNEEWVRLKDASGQVLTIAVADIDEEAEGQSLMPLGITKFLTRQELVDLVRFISELGKPGPYMLPAQPCIRRWRLLKEPSSELSADPPHGDLLREQVLRAPPEAWRSVYSLVSGVVPLDELCDGPGVLYLQGELDVFQAGEVQLQLECTEPAVFWVDVQPVTDHVATLRLEPGRHAITIRVAVQPPAQTASFDANQPPQLLFTLARPPNSPALFEPVGGP